MKRTALAREIDRRIVLSLLEAASSDDPATAAASLGPLALWLAWAPPWLLADLHLTAAPEFPA